jgi:hypothetical protein
MSTEQGSRMTRRQGVILFRLGAYAELVVIINRLDYVLTHQADQLDCFLVVERHRVCVRVGPNET